MIQNGDLWLYTVTSLHNSVEQSFLMSKSPQDVLRQIKDEGIELIDLKFTDLHVKWQHLTVCTDLLDEESFTEGLAFDGSYIR